MTWYSKLLEILNSLVGLSSSIEVVNKFGENLDIDTVNLNQVIWPIRNDVQDYLFIDTPIQLFLKSDSANDTIAGTGAQKVKVFYQTDETEKSVILDTNGVTNVPLPELSMGVFRKVVTQTGTINSANLGNIDIVDGSGNIYSRIVFDVVTSVSEGQTQIAVYRVPNDKKGIIKSAVCDYGRLLSNNDAAMRLRVRSVNGTVVTKVDGSVTANDTELNIVYRQGGPEVEPGEWVFWECLEVSSNATPIAARFAIVLEDV